MVSKIFDFVPIFAKEHFEISILKCSTTFQESLNTKNFQELQISRSFHWRLETRIYFLNAGSNFKSLFSRDELNYHCDWPLLPLQLAWVYFAGCARGFYTIDSRTQIASTNSLGGIVSMTLGGDFFHCLILNAVNEIVNDQVRLCAIFVNDCVTNVVVSVHCTCAWL